MKLRAALVYLLVVIGALLAGYGASYGVHASNLVFVTGVALIALLAFVEWVTFRRALSVPIAIAFIGLFFFVAGYRTLSLPACPPPAGVVACAREGARERTLGALGGLVVGAAVTFGLVARQVRAEPSRSRRR